MNKRNLIVCAAEYVHIDGGYLSRIMSEVDKIYNDFNIYMFIPKGPTTEELFENKVRILQYPYTDKNDLITYLANVKSCKEHFKKFIQQIDNPIIYCEALVGSMWVLDIARKSHLQIVFDCHGTEADEILMRPHTIKRIAYAYVLKHYERIAIESSDLIVTVSNKQYEKWGINKKHVKFPMVPSEQFYESNDYRQEIRKQLDIPCDATVFVYSGGTAIWQMCAETIEVYKKIEDINSSAFLLVLSGSKDVFKELIEQYGIKRYCIMTAKYDEVPHYLDAADFGFCIRANHIVNNVASPTKILEYLARNVKPIITGYIGDFSEELGGLNLACIMNESLDNLHEIRKDNDFDGKSYVNRVKSEYVENYVSALNKLQ